MLPLAKHKSILTPLFKVGIVVFLVYFLSEKQLFEVVFGSYSGVGIFIISTLLIIYLFEHYTANSLLNFLTKHQRLQIPIATFLGLLPGCGGAVIVVTQYSKGFVTFGAMAATLIATTGDATIILMHKKPQAAFTLFTIASAIGMVVGYLIDFFSKEKFLPRSQQKKEIAALPKHKLSHKIALAWFALVTFNAFTYFTPSLFSKQIIHCSNYIGITSCLILWLIKTPGHSCEKKHCNTCHDTFSKVAIEASFILSWVFIGMAAYHVITTLSSLDIKALVQTNIYYIPLAAAIIGLIPGCGPQIILATMYINGSIPFSAQVANGISNDGDALMPAIAMQPKKALLVTVCGFVPAVLVGYILLFLGY